MAQIKKKIYELHEETQAMNQDDVTQWRKDNNDIRISKVKGELDESDDTKPCLTFDAAFHNMPEILTKLKNQPFSKPTPIQSQLWPLGQG